MRKKKRETAKRQISVADKDRITGTLYHLGKGLWKSLPVIGPVIEEVFYEQFRSELLDQVDSLSPQQLDELQQALPSREQVEKLETQLADLSTEQRTIAANQLFQVLDQFDSVEQSLEEIQGGVNRLSSVINDVAKDLLDAEEVNELIRRLRSRRAEWRKRISNNQKRLLASIPNSYTELSQLWESAQKILPDCVYKEFRFRLHELEWLELVERKRSNNNWEYRQSDINGEK